jgi:ABC-type uncharacterized transport system permease subunit
LATGIPARLSSAPKESREFRRFGLLVGGILAALAAWPAVFRGASPRIWLLIVAAALITLALVFPRSLKPVYQCWMRVGHVLGWVNTQLILGVAYFLLLTPIGLVMRLVGRDPLDRDLRDRKSYWVTREQPADIRQSMELRF